VDARVLFYFIDNQHWQNFGRVVSIDDLESLKSALPLQDVLGVQISFFQESCRKGSHKVLSIFGSGDDVLRTAAVAGDGCVGRQCALIAFLEDFFERHWRRR